MDSIILTVGLNHTTAPIRVRELIASAPCMRDDALDYLRKELDPHTFPEALVLSTCNRTEVYTVTTDRSIGEQALQRLFAGNEALAAAGAEYLYAYSDRPAVEHLFSVASGIDSMLVGEFEILGQVRSAYLTAGRAKTIGPVFHRLFKDAIHAGKRARAETSIGAGAMSATYAAVTLARQHLGSLAGRHILVIGTGEMGQRAARNLVDSGASTVIVANRTLDHAKELAAELGGRAVRFDELADALAQADLVLSATSAPHIVLSAAAVRTAMATRPERPLCLLDIAVPRDIDPEAAQIENVHLYNIDDLQQLVDQNVAAREEAIVQVKKIVSEEVTSFWHWYLGRKAAPLLADLNSRSEAIRSAELEKALRRLGHLNLTERDRNVITALSAGIVSKLLASPTAHLKHHAQNGDGQLYLDVVRELFDLETDLQAHRTL